MRRNRIILCLLPLVWAAVACSPRSYVREPVMDEYQTRRGPQAPSSQRGGDDFDATRRYLDNREQNKRAPRVVRRPRRQPRAPQYRAPRRPRVSRKAVRTYRRYVRRCVTRIRTCQAYGRRARSTIQQIRRSMYRMNNPYYYDRARGHLHVQHRKLNRYKRCIRLYKYRMRWAQRYFRRRYGFLPRVQVRRRRYARAPRRWAQPPSAQRRWAPPPTAKRPSQQPLAPKVAPLAPKVAPVTPKRPRVAMRPPQAPAPKPELPPTTPTRGPQRWQSYCASEKQKYPYQQKVTYLRRSAAKSGKIAWSASAFAHKDMDAITALNGQAGRYVVLGSDGRYSRAHCEDRVFHVWDTRSQQVKKLRPPVTAFFLQNRHLLPWFQGKASSSVTETLLSYEPSRGRAGLMIKVAFPAMKGRSRYMYLVWDLRQNRIIQSWTLGSPGCHGAYRPVGVTPDGTKLYYIQNDSRVMIGCGPVARSTARAKGMRLFYRLLVMDLVRGSRREVASIAPSQKRLQVLTATKRFDKVAVVEYADMKTNRGRAYVVDTSRGTVRSFVAPLTPYGMAFSRDESRLTIYSAKQGQLVNIALAGGQRTAHKTHKLGHAMGYSRDGRHIYVVFHSGTEVRDAATMKRVGYIKHRAFMGNVKFIHVDGSAVGGGTVFVKNGEKLYVQQLSHGTTAKVLDKKQPGTLPKHKMQPRTPTLRKQPNSPQNAPRLPDTQSVKKQQSDNDWLRGGTAY